MLTPTTATIERLKIQGIRSFSNKEGNIIHFYAPLTLIVGYNGSGKTTIIECLKYATTGLQPPNTKGGAFIHDPKLTNEKEVLAQVKLEFKDAAQDKIVITRSLQLTVKKTGMTMKTLDSQLLTVHNRERTASSQKNSSIDAIIPRMLGVSRAILDNVIFCHQDESLWPMSEPSKLKVKFDEIFDAQKYTQAIENLNKLRKGHRESLGKLKIHEENNRANKDKADKVQKKSLVLEKEIDEIRKQLADADEGRRVAEETATEKKRLMNVALGLVNDLNNKTKQAEGLEYTLNSLRSGGFQELQETDEWLQTTLDQYEQRMQELDKQSRKYGEEYQTLKKSLEKNAKSVLSKQSERGQRLAEENSYENQLMTRTQLVKEAARSHSLRGYDGDLEEDQVLEFVERIQKLSQEKDRELDRINKATNDELRQTQAVLTELDTRQATRTQEKVNAKQTIEANARKSRARQVEMDAIKMDEGQEAALKASLHDVQERLRKANADFEAAAWDHNLKTEDSELRELELEAQRLQDLLFQSNKLASDHAALKYAKTHAKAAEGSLDVMRSTHDDQLTQVIGAGWQAESLEREYQVIRDQKDRSFAEAKKQQEGAERDLRDNEFKLKTATLALKKKTEEMEKCQVTVLKSILDPDDRKPLSSVDIYLSELQSIESERNDVRKELDGIQYVRDYYSKGLDTVQKRNCCRLCERSFADKQEQASAAKKLETLLAKYVKSQQEKVLNSLEDDLRTAEAARPQYETYKRLHHTEIPSLEKEVKALESQKAKLVQICTAKDNKVNDESIAKRDVEALISTVNDIAKYQAAIAKHQEEMSRLSSQQKLSGSTMTAEEIQPQLTSCGEQIRTIKVKIQTLTTSKDHAKAEIVKLENEVGSVSNKLSTAQFQLEKKRGLQNAISELRDDTSQQREAITRADKDLEAIIPESAKAKAQDDDARRRGQAKQKEVQAEKEKLAQTVNQFRLVDNAINQYIENDGAGRLAACERAIQALEQEKTRLDSEIAQVTQSANDLKERLQSSKDTQVSIKENLRYRKTEKDLAVVKQDISEMEGRNAEKEHSLYRKEAQAWDDKYQILSANRHSLLGTMNATDKELGGLLEEWETEYKNAANLYRETHVKVETTKAAIEDMGKCSLALENAIMKFHTLKMEEINAIAAELWRSTYQGSDIDTIMIRSENETSSNATKRNYNYRLVMVKQDAEMDMRGRCSAGQRVLASIIIRLALAECFGINCGVIALDEPTTNLDQENVRALAHSLHAIIKARKHQSNFQLIIITHDEEFLKEMQCAEFCDYFWRVSRDSNQCSTIERQSLADFQ